MRIIVTGAKGLIGSEVTRYLKEKHTVIEYDLALGHDFTDEKQVKKLLSVKADALVNLFALNDHIGSKRKSVEPLDISLDSFREYLNVNLTALFSVCREYARHNHKGAIVNFSSTYASHAPHHSKHIGYTVSKAGVVMLTKHLAVALAPRIRVNCIAPGGVRHKQSLKFQDYYGSMTPMGRMMDVSELNKMVEFLCTDSPYVTGAEFKCDGGYTAW